MKFRYSRAFIKILISLFPVTFCKKSSKHSFLRMKILPFYKEIKLNNPTSSKSRKHPSIDKSEENNLSLIISTLQIVAFYTQIVA